MSGLSGNAGKHGGYTETHHGHTQGTQPKGKGCTKVSSRFSHSTVQWGHTTGSLLKESKHARKARKARKALRALERKARVAAKE